MRRTGRSKAHMARIDHSLADRHEAREVIRQLLASATPADSISSEAVKTLRASILKVSPGAPAALLDVYLSGSRDERDLAFLVLSGMRAKTLEPHVAAIIKNKQTTDEQRLQLVALTAFDATGGRDLEESLQGVGAELGDLVRLFASMVADKLEPEETAMMYLQDFADQPDDERLLFLQFLIDQGLPEFLPILEVESRNPDFRVRMAVARALPRFPFRETLYTAEFLLNDSSPAVRFDAQCAMDELKRRAALDYHVPPPEFHRACFFMQPEDGVGTLFYAVRSARGKIKCLATLIDFWTHGIVEAWGNVGLTDDDFTAVIEEFVGDARKHGMHGELERYELEREQALHLFTSALEFTSRQGEVPPTELFLFDRLFRDEEFGDEEEGLELFTFGARCVDCEQEVRPNRSRTNIVPLGAGDLLCRACASKQRICRACGGRYRVKDVDARWRNISVIGNMCKACIECGGKK